MKIFHNTKTNIDNRLEEVLEECRKESKRSYKIAMDIFDDMTESLGKSIREIRKGMNAIDGFSFSDKSLGTIPDTLKKQLLAIETDLQSDAQNTQSDLLIKYQHDKNFNITLFGRTMVGKSTLMAILTHANEDAIGKGAQRTTRDVRQYEWQGMAVTDVPGIDAFDGKDDEIIAENAAKNADLIIFMISSGQPESSEADWLIKLKKEDKAILCLCNYKKAFKSPTILKLKLKNKAALIADMNLEGLKKQFNEFLRTELPNEHIEIYVSMLLAELMANNPEYKDIKKDLFEISRFDEFKKAIIAQVLSRGVFYRRKSYLSLIDVPVYNHYLQLRKFSIDTYSTWLSVHQKQEEFRNWQRDFNKSEKSRLREKIDDIFGDVQNSISQFVEDNVECGDINNRWKRHIERYNIDSKTHQALEISLNKCQNKINEFFNDLGTDINMTGKISSFSDVSGVNVGFNWKRAWGWGSAAAGVGAAIGFALISNPVGWVLTGIGALFGLFGWISNSREKKLRQARKELYDSLSASIDKAKQNTMPKVTKKFEELVCDKMQKSAFNRLSMIQATLLTVLNVERRCSMDYCARHTSITQQLVETILSFDTINYGSRNIRIKKVARIPGKRIVLVTDDYIEDKTKRFISSWMGSNEKVETLSLHFDNPIFSQLSYLTKRFVPGVYLKYKLLKNGEAVIYSPKGVYSQVQLDGMDIIQQLLHLPIIFTNI